MNKGIILLEGYTPAMVYAKQFLLDAGYIFADAVAQDIRYVLLDVPSFHNATILRNGKDLDTLLAALPNDVIICGGNLNCKTLDAYQTIDFLQDETYLAGNAAITANCAIRVAIEHLTSTLADSPALVIGWGRIGKCLARMLKSMGCDVSIAARKEKDRAILDALGYPAIDIPEIKPARYRLIYNTVPDEILDVSKCSSCLKIDLASKKGLIGEDVVWARGLPGMYAPETSGKLIAETFLRLTREVGT